MIADDYKAIARAMRRNTWKAEKIASFRCEESPREVPPELARRFVTVDIDKPLTVADILIATELQKAGLVQSIEWTNDFHSRLEGRNGDGDPWRTDGRLAIV